MGENSPRGRKQTHFLSQHSKKTHLVYFFSAFANGSTGRWLGLALPNKTQYFFWQIVFFHTAVTFPTPPTPQSDSPTPYSESLRVHSAMVGQVMRSEQLSVISAESERQSVRRLLQSQKSRETEPEIIDWRNWRRSGAWNWRSSCKRTEWLPEGGGKSIHTLY